MASASALSAGVGAFTLRRWTNAGERDGDSARSGLRVALLGVALLSFVVWAFFDATRALGP